MSRVKKEHRPVKPGWRVAALIMAAILLAEGLVVGFAFVAYFFNFDTYRGGDEPDRLGDYNNINQELRRTGDWEQIVRDSPFHLGEPIRQFISAGPDHLGTVTRLEGETYPTIDGSTVMIPMGIEFARQHLGFTDQQAARFSDYSTTATAYDSLFNLFSDSKYVIELDSKDSYCYTGRPLDLFLGTAPSEEELAMAQRNGIEPVVKPVCLDSFVFITHKDNPVNSLTLEQIRGIYSGKIKNWKELGGDDAAIVPYQREANSGSQTGMEQLVMQDTPLMQPQKVQMQASMGHLIDAVAEYKNGPASIGYTYQYYVNNLYKNDEIRILQINGVAPTDDNVRSGTYPLCVNYYGVIRKGDETARGGKFLDWILSPEGQACVKQAGYLPVAPQDQ
ncbi:MAG: substrate-binding domain-containing protein [Oscillospiraceae bacterium]|jgi:phosphate transport system substrate-binding protein|nr:substrate-binding domain-containing protein [Oscillospiraceae bacterium]